MASSSPGFNNTTGNSGTDDVGRGPRAAFLLIFIVITLVGNLFLLSVLVLVPRRKLVQNTLIANMCALGLLDCAANMSLVFGAVAANDWEFGRAMCKINSFFMSLVAVHTAFMVFAFSLDRFMMLRFSQYESSVSSCKLASILVFIWIHAIAFSVPFITDSVPSTFRSQLHICAVTGEAPLIFVCVTMLICYLCPVLITLGIHIAHYRLSCKLQVKRKAENVGKTYTQVSKEETTSLCPPTSVHSTYLPPVVFTLWIILAIPFIVTNYIKQYEFSQALENDPLVSYPWEVDATFLWMRFFFTAIFPVLVLLCRKELWQCVKDCCLCRRSNAIVDMKSFVLEAKDLPVTKTGENHQPMEEKDGKKEPEKEKESPKIVSHMNGAFTVPVLFATSTGICIEDSSCAQELQVEKSSDYDFLSASATHVKGKSLDICYPECDYTHELVGDTSDYDSSCEVDLYSTSQPVSVTTVHSNSHPPKQRSVSNPDITSGVNARRKSSQSGTRGFSGTSGADSGLDLTGTHSLAVLTSATKHAAKRTGKSRINAWPTVTPDSCSEVCVDQTLKPQSSSEDANFSTIVCRQDSPGLKPLEKLKEDSYRNGDSYVAENTNPAESKHQKDSARIYINRLGVLTGNLSLGVRKKTFSADSVKQTDSPIIQ